MVSVELFNILFLWCRATPTCGFARYFCVCVCQNCGVVSWQMLGRPPPPKKRHVYLCYSYMLVLVCPLLKHLWIRSTWKMVMMEILRKFDGAKSEYDVHSWQDLYICLASSQPPLLTHTFHTTLAFLIKTRLITMRSKPNYVEFVLL